MSKRLSHYNPIFPIVLAMETWGFKLRNHKILFMCDNQAVVYIVNMSSSKDPNIMKLVRRLVLTTLQHNIYFRAKHIPGVSNVISDKLSRFKLQEAFDLAHWLNRTQSQVPAHLRTL